MGHTMTDESGAGCTTYYDKSARYDGDWNSFLRQGKGTFEFVSGTSYEGHWDGGCIQSDGGTTTCQAKFNNGDVYQGEWANGCMAGQGEYRYANGDVYTGGWANNQREGPGLYKYSNGGVYLGAWRGGRWLRGGVEDWDLPHTTCGHCGGGGGSQGR